MKKLFCFLTIVLIFCAADILYAECDGSCAQYCNKGYCVDYINKQLHINKSGNAKNWLKDANVCPDDVQANDVAIFDLGKYGHVALVDYVDGDNVTLSEWNYGSKLINKECGVTNEFNTLHSPRRNIPKSSVTKFWRPNGSAVYTYKPIVSQLEYFWIPGPYSNNCESGKAHYRIEEGPTKCSVTQVSALEACAAIKSRCQQSSSSNTNSYAVNFIQALLGRQALAASDYPSVAFSTLCNATVTHAYVCMAGNTIQTIFSKDSGLLVSYPATEVAGTTKPDPLPDLKVRNITVFDSNGTTLTQNSSSVTAGQVLDIQVQLISENADCSVGMKAGKDTVETDVFYKIALSDDDGNYKFLGRVYS